MMSAMFCSTPDRKAIIRTPRSLAEKGHLKLAEFRIVGLIGMKNILKSSCTSA